MNRFARPIIFGEVLIDIHPDGATTLGGAPFNVAWHLHGFGCNPLFISAVGTDSYGKQILSAMNEWGCDTSGLQCFTAHSTGTVSITLDNNEPSFCIHSNKAYDHICPEQAYACLPQNAPFLLYCGTLALRAQANRSLISNIIRTHNPKIFCDLNLRPECYDRHIIHELLGCADWIKINVDEARMITGTHIMLDTAEPAISELAERYSIESVILTAGASGSAMYNNGCLSIIPSSQVTHFFDSVGAGDAFCAVIILGLLSGWDMHIAMQRASDFAAHICSIRGAITRSKNVYKQFLTQWND